MSLHLRIYLPEKQELGKYVEQTQNSQTQIKVLDRRVPDYVFVSAVKTQHCLLIFQRKLQECHL